MLETAVLHKENVYVNSEREKASVPLRVKKSKMAMMRNKTSYCVCWAEKHSKHTISLRESGLGGGTYTPFSRVVVNADISANSFVY